MPKTPTRVVHSREDQLLADLVSERLRKKTLAERALCFKDVVDQILDEQGYPFGHSERRLHQSAVCSILGGRGGSKKPKTPRKVELVKIAGELFVGRKVIHSIPVILPRSVPKYHPPATPLWPAITKEMTPEERQTAQSRRNSLWNDMMLTARLRRDALAREADGE